MIKQLSQCSIALLKEVTASQILMAAIPYAFQCPSCFHFMDCSGELASSFALLPSSISSIWQSPPQLLQSLNK